MILPPGVTYNPRQTKLIARTPGPILGIITIDTTFKHNDRYTVHEVSLDADFEKRLKGDWADFDLLFHLSRFQELPDGQTVPVAVRSTAVHGGHPKLPDITVVPNLTIDDAAGLSRPFTVFGCDFGRHFPADGAGAAVRNVVEFESSGMLLVDRQEGELDLWIARRGDKVAISVGCHATLYNFGDRDHPLVTLDYASPAGASRNDPLNASFGPPLLAYYDDFEVTFIVNRLYANNPEMRGCLHVRPGDDPAARTIRLVRTTRQDLGSFLQDQFVHNSDLIARFAKLGINVRHPTGDVVLQPFADSTAGKLFFSRPLVHAVAEGTRVHRFFFPATPAFEPLPGVDWRVLRRPPARPNAPSSRPLDRPLVLVIEGAGAWVRDAYRKLFLKKVAEGARLSVFYADDPRWSGRPQWTVPGGEDGLRPWETYLDKADPNDYYRYTMLRPDAVFVVTPDAMHAATAANWLDKTPTIFIEKPFDSDLRNVEGLQFTAGRRKTEIIGLDHYQFYAGPLRELRDSIARIVGDTLKSVDFVLAESVPIELGRERSLQHGLTLDLLPHFVALLTFFGDVRKIDEISIAGAWRYRPLEARKGNERRNIADEFRNETASRIDFTFEDMSGNGFRVPCRAVVGKGFSRDVKYLQVNGTTGHSLRIDLLTDATRRPADADPKYPWGSLFFLSSSAVPSTRPMRDPYLSGRNGDGIHVFVDEQQEPVCKPLEERYRRLIEDLLNGTDSAAFSSLTMTQGGSVVSALDRIWWAIQQSRPWKESDLQKLDPMHCLLDLV